MRILAGFDTNKTHITINRSVFYIMEFRIENTSSSACVGLDLMISGGGNTVLSITQSR